MTDINIEELFIKVSETATKADMDTLIITLKGLVDLKDESVTNGLELLFDAWTESVTETPQQASFIIALAELNPPSTSQFRNILADAIKACLPPYLRKPGYLKAIGLRDADVHYKEVVTRFTALSQLKVGVYTFNIESNAWGMVGQIDEFAGSVSISNVTGRNSSSVSLQ